MNISKRMLKVLIGLSGLLLLNRVVQVFLPLWGVASSFLSSFNPQEASSIGIIGGSDGPTAIYLKSENIFAAVISVFCYILETFLYAFVFIKSISALKKS